jgi:hypothetical protein
VLILFYRRQFRELNIVLTEGGDKYGREIDEYVKINVIIFKFINVWPSFLLPNSMRGKRPTVLHLIAKYELNWNSCRPAKYFCHEEIGRKNGVAIPVVRQQLCVWGALLPVNKYRYGYMHSWA